MGKKKTRRKFTAEQKANIIRRHLKGKVPVSDLCDEYKIRHCPHGGWGQR
jgi:transposase-like protein